MKNKTDKEWLAEKRWMYKRANFITGFSIPIRDVPKGSKEIAFTRAESLKDISIYLSKDNVLTDGLSDSKKRAIHIGMFAHELCHVQFTDFEYCNTFAKTLTPGEAYIFNIIFNVVEDAAMENMAPSVLKENMVKALKYKIARAYEVSPKLQTEETPFNQFMLALVHYGNMGPLKGNFTFSEAKDAFYKNITEVNELIMNGDPQERIDITYRIFENTRPLWNDIAEEYNGLSSGTSGTGSIYGLPGLFGSSGAGAGAGTGPSSGTGSEPSVLELLEKLLEASGTGISSGVTVGEDIDPDEIADNADLSKGARRNITVKKISDMDSDEREAYEEEMKSRNEEYEKKKEKEDSVLSRSSEAEYVDNGVADDEGKIIVSDDEISLKTDKDYDPEEYEIEKNVLDSYERIIQAEIELGSAEAKVEAEIPNFDSISEHYTARMYKCRNNIIKVSDPDEARYAYDKIVKKSAAQINSAIKQLKALFVEDAEEEEAASRGKIDLEKATMSTTATTKLFTKKKDPKDKSNMAVIIAIDESGSMYGSRIERAKETAICLTEMFGALGIPVYVMGYTADMGGADAYHNHYIFWDNKKEDRYRLTTITSNCNNFDGYSIRYASKLLGLRPELHKVMIVISDGQPACGAYRYADSGYRDTKDAIREARSNGQIVLGVGIGTDENILHEMYGLDFIFIERISDLFMNISKKFKSMVAKW